MTRLEALRDVAVAALEASATNPVMAAACMSMPYAIIKMLTAYQARGWGLLVGPRPNTVHDQATLVFDKIWGVTEKMTMPQIATPIFSLAGSKAPRVQKPMDVAALLGAIMKSK